MSSYITEKSNEELIKYTFNQELSKAKENINEMKNKLIELYKKNNGKKKCGLYYDEELYSPLENDEDEGIYKNYLWDQIQHFNQLNVNPKSAFELALNFKKTADKLNITWNKPIIDEFWGGHFSEPYLKATITPQLASDYEDYLYDIETSKSRMKHIVEQMKYQKINSSQLNEEQWLYLIALYYIKNNIKLEKDIVFRPKNKNKPDSLFEINNYIIEYKYIKYKIKELSKINIEIEETKKLFEKIKKKYDLNKDNIKNIEIHQYIYIISNYYQKYPESFKSNYIFHPPIPIDDQKEYSENVFNINMNDIKIMSNHLLNIKNKLNSKLLDEIKEWSYKNNNLIKQDNNMSNFKWIQVIRTYYEINQFNIKKDIVFYIEKQESKKKDLSINYYIIDYDDLTEDLFGLYEYNSNSDESI